MTVAHIYNYFLPFSIFAGLADVKMELSRLQEQHKVHEETTTTRIVNLEKQVSLLRFQNEKPKFGTD